MVLVAVLSDASHFQMLPVFTPDIHAWPRVFAELPLSELLPVREPLPCPDTVTMMVHELRTHGWHPAYPLTVVRHPGNAVFEYT